MSSHTGDDKQTNTDQNITTPQRHGRGRLYQSTVTYLLTNYGALATNNCLSNEDDEDDMKIGKIGLIYLKQV